MIRFTQILLCLFCFTQAQAQVAPFVLVPAAPAGPPTVGTVTVDANASFSHNNNGTFLVIAGVDYNTTWTAVSYAGSPMTKIRDTTSSAADYACLWYHASPASGSNTVSITGTGGSQSTAAISISGGSSIGNTGAAIATSTTPSVNVTSSSSRIVIDAVAAYVSTFTLGADQTQLMNVTLKGASSYETGASPTTMSWTIANAAWAIVAAEIVP